MARQDTGPRLDGMRSVSPQKRAANRRLVAWWPFASADVRTATLSAVNPRPANVRRRPTTATPVRDDGLTAHDGAEPIDRADAHGCNAAQAVSSLAPCPRVTSRGVSPGCERRTRTRCVVQYQFYYDGLGRNQWPVPVSPKDSPGRVKRLPPAAHAPTAVAGLA